MAVKIILTLVLIALAVASVGFAGYEISEERNGGAVVGGILAVVLLLTLLIVPGSIHVVDTGEVAVVKRMGETIGTRSSGTHFDFWITHSYQTYDFKTQSMDITTAAYSSDAQTMDIQMTLQYRVQGDKVTEIAKQYGSLDKLQARIQSVAIEKCKSVLSGHKAMDIIANRAAMSPAVEAAIKDAIGDEYYVDVTTVVLANIDFSDAFEQAVEEKMISEQNQLKAEYENAAKVAKAQADADAKIIAAKAEAEANQVLEHSLTDKILQEMYIEKWNGQLPQVMTGDSGLDMMLPSMEGGIGG